MLFILLVVVLHSSYRYRNPSVPGVGCVQEAEKQKRQPLPSVFLGPVPSSGSPLSHILGTFSTHTTPSESVSATLVQLMPYLASKQENVNGP